MGQRAVKVTPTRDPGPVGDGAITPELTIHTGSVERIHHRQVVSLNEKFSEIHFRSGYVLPVQNHPEELEQEIFHDIQDMRNMEEE